MNRTEKAQMYERDLGGSKVYVGSGRVGIKRKKRRSQVKAEVGRGGAYVEYRRKF